MYESDIEELTLEKLQAQEYEYIYGPTIAPEGEHPERQSWDGKRGERHAPQFISLYRPEVNIDFLLRFFHHV